MPVSRRLRLFLIAFLTLGFGMHGPAHAWKNGPPNNKVTNSAKDCVNPPYSTHDWVADQARALLPPAERAWLDPHRKLLLIGTEAPDYAKIRLACGVPHQGYNDTGGGKHDLRFDDFGNVTNDLPARRAQEEYDKAVIAYRSGRPDHAAFYLGAAAHYIGDLAQYGHTIAGETHHADFEEWVGSLTPSFAGGGVFEKFIHAGGLLRRNAYDAVVDTGTFTHAGKVPVLAPAEMDRRFDPTASPDPVFIGSIGATLNKAVNETANMLHSFFQDVVMPTASARQ